MPDSTKNFAIDTANAPMGATTVTRSQLIDILEHMNYVDGSIRSIDNLSGSAGILQVDGSGGASVKSVVVNDGIGVTNGDGSGGNPTIGVGDAVSLLQNILSVETSAVTLDYPGSVLTGTTTSYSLPTPHLGKSGFKVILNKLDGATDVTITAPDGASGSISSTLAKGCSAIFFHDHEQKWYVPAAEDSTLT